MNPQFVQRLAAALDQLEEVAFDQEVSGALEEKLFELCSSVRDISRENV